MKHWSELTKTGKSRRINLIFRNEYIENDTLWRFRNDYLDFKSEDSLDNMRRYFKYNDQFITNKYNL